jgi:hypothetical protein
MNRVLMLPSFFVFLCARASAVDAHVGNFLFHTCIREALADRTRVLVTHQLQFVHKADHVVLMSGGRIADQGSYAELMKREGGMFRALMDDYGGQHNKDENKDKTDDDSEKHDDATDETTGEDKEAAQERRLRRRPASSAATAPKDATTAAPAKDSAESKALEALMQSEERVKGGVKSDIYLYYLKSCGGWAPCLGVMVFLFASSGTQAYTSWWLGDWTDNKWGKSQNFYVGIYSAISMASILFTTIMMIFCCFMSVRASRVLHERSFARVIRAPLAFFDTTVSRGDFPSSAQALSVRANLPP